MFVQTQMDARHCKLRHKLFPDSCSGTGCVYIVVPEKQKEPDSRDNAVQFGSCILVCDSSLNKT